MFINDIENEWDLCHKWTNGVMRQYTRKNGEYWRLFYFPLVNRQARPRLPGVVASVWQYLAAVGPGFAPVAI